MIFPKLILKSLLNRRSTVALTIISIAFSVALLLGVEKIRQDTHHSFSNTVSGTDLIVGARTGRLALLLYSVFHIGNASNNISWEGYKNIITDSSVAWSIPISLGDSHRGYRVMGTNTDYFKFYRHGRKQLLSFKNGRPFDALFDVVVGHDVAKNLNYTVGQKIVLSHGVGEVSFSDHGDKPFVIVGIINKTGTPVDKTVHVSLQAIEAIHLDWQSGYRNPVQAVSVEQSLALELEPKTITAFMLGLNSRLKVFTLQRSINQYKSEPLLAVLPGATLQELWSLFGLAESALLAITGLVVFSGLLGMLTAILGSLNERRRELAILRSVGARPRQILMMLCVEAGLITGLGIFVGVILYYLAVIIMAPIVETNFGLTLTLSGLSLINVYMLLIIQFSGILIGFIPGFFAYRMTLNTGITVRL
ncbi:peptide ABC transporter permease [Gammaproteobacteria bacterium 45_16_T64]|nr:peptide ABC transporter permease [Gammaproteobacteria bacterium 45_16_T64]